VRAGILQADPQLPSGRFEEGHTLVVHVADRSRTAISFYESLGAVAISGNVTMYLEVNG
jgi:hypothetical protein